MSWHEDFTHSPEDHQRECVEEPARCPNCGAPTGGTHWWVVPDDHRCSPQAWEALMRSIGYEGDYPEQRP